MKLRSVSVFDSETGKIVPYSEKKQEVEEKVKRVLLEIISRELYGTSTPRLLDSGTK